jgi:hypothetical protein
MPSERIIPASERPSPVQYRVGCGSIRNSRPGMRSVWCFQPKYGDFANTINNRTMIVRCDEGRADRGETVMRAHEA